MGGVGGMRQNGRRHLRPDDPVALPEQPGWPSLSGPPRRWEFFTLTASATGRGRADNGHVSGNAERSGGAGVLQVIDCMINDTLHISRDEAGR